jgi:mono/diheme cytochrome c family protein
MRKRATYAVIGGLVLALLLALFGWATSTQEPVAIPALAAGAVPDYTVHVAPLLQARCVSCHQGSGASGGYVMTSYADVLGSGAHAPNVRGADLQSNLIRMINRETIAAGGPMPPLAPLRPEEIDVITRWVMAGAPAAEITAP